MLREAMDEMEHGYRIEWQRGERIGKMKVCAGKKASCNAGISAVG